MKKIMSILLSLVLVLGFTSPTSASFIAVDGESNIGTELETQAKKVARIQAEVLSGNITND